MASRTTHLQDVAIRYQVYLERLKAGRVANFDPQIVKLDRELRKLLNNVGSGQLNKLSKPQLNKLLEQVRYTVGYVTDAFVDGFVADLQKIAEYAVDFETKTLVSVTSKKVAKTTAQQAFNRAYTNPIEATGDLLQDFTTNWKASVARNVEGAIRTGYSQGKTVGQIVTDIRGRKANNYKDGILTGKTRREASAMVRTAIQHTSAQAREAVWEQNADIVDGYMWVSTLDTRTTQICRSLDGMTFKVGKGPTPPIHIGCRSVTVAIIAGVNLLAFAKRASKGASGGSQVPADMTYYEWLKTQPSDFQDDAIGVDRAKLLRKGGLSAEKFAALNLDKNFHPLTLDEMRKKEPAAFARAGI